MHIWLVWLVSVLLAGMATLVLISVLFSDWLDVCNANHEPANTPLGFLLAGFGCLIPVGIVVRFRSIRLTGAAVSIALLEALVWYWLLTPVGTC